MEISSFNGNQDIGNVRVIKPNEVVYLQLKALEEAQWKKFFYCTSNINMESMKPEQFKLLKNVIKEKKKVIKAFNLVFEKFMDKENPCLNCKLSSGEIEKATDDLAKATACGTDEVEFLRQFDDFQAELAKHAKGQLKNMEMKISVVVDGIKKEASVPSTNETNSEMDVHEVDYPYPKIKTEQHVQTEAAN